MPGCAEKRNVGLDAGDEGLREGLKDEGPCAMFDLSIRKDTEPYRNGYGEN